MSVIKQLYRSSLALLTDLYQLTMAYGYWKLGMTDTEAVFHLFYRRNPFQGGFAVACGLEYVTGFLSDLRFEADDVEYLATLRGADGRELFDAGFLAYLRDLRLTCDVDGVGEGTVVFPQEPLLRVRGSLLQCQLIETPLLNMMNFQTLIATKSARICMAARGEPVLEFGLRRAQGIDGGVAASRAAYVGGCAGTSNVLAGKLFGIPVKGTHAHSWVMAFDDELEAFEAYARAMPNNCVFLVDTYDTLEGVRRACRVGVALRQRGYRMIGIRLDSGDLAALSKAAREILDEAGLTDAAVVASNDLDEFLIASLKDQGAAIGVWGVGTRLATAYDEPALGGVYKLTAVREPGGKWRHKLKLSEEAVKTTTPGVLQVRRFRDGGRYVGDMIHDLLTPPADEADADAEYADLLEPIVREGNVVWQSPPLEQIRRFARDQLAGFDEGVKRLHNPDQYPVTLERGLRELKTRLIARARSQETGGAEEIPE